MLLEALDLLFSPGSQRQTTTEKIILMVARHSTLASALYGCSQFTFAPSLLNNS